MSQQQTDDQPQCPFCGSRSVELHALFGSMMLTSQYYCYGCRTVFERIRDDQPPDTQTER